MKINPITFAEQEYEQPFADIVAGYAADGVSLFRTAEILHVEREALRQYAVENNIQMPGLLHQGSTPSCLPLKDRRLARRQSGQSPRYCFRGLDLTPIEWAEHTGIPNKTISRRLERGWPIHKTLTTPVMNRQQVARLGVQARKEQRP